VVHQAEAQFKSMYGRAHGLVFLLDPRFIGQEGLIPAAQHAALKNILIDIPRDNHTPIDGAQREVIYVQFTDYISSWQQRED
jgi:hypothetical protein